MRYLPLLLVFAALTTGNTALASGENAVANRANPIAGHAATIDGVANASCENANASSDRLWAINTRHLPRSLCYADNTSPAFQIHRLNVCGGDFIDDSPQYDEFLESLLPGRRVVIHVHGNRMTHAEACARGRFVYRSIKHCLDAAPLDFIVFSWPSEQRGILVKDGREKAAISEAAGIYLANLLYALTQRQASISLVGYSFGCRVITGGMHVLAGGDIRGRCLTHPPIQGANINVGLLAPAVQSDWLGSGRPHGLAAQNISRLVVLYNSRDAVLKRYWLIESDSSRFALGFRGPSQVAPGYDGFPIDVRRFDCARFLGLAHSEIEYYTDGCHAGSLMAALVLRAEH